MISRIDPKWIISDFENLNYTFSTHRDEELVEDYVRSGHNRENMSMYKYHLPNKMPVCIDEYILPRFNFLNNAAPAINYFKPGQYLPLHIDLFGRYAEIFNANPKNIIRCMVMLEDSSPGQILQVKDTAHCKWKSGDCFYWNYDEIHAFYNFSMNDRYAVQITGILK
jgi:hypothetical protein